MRKSWTTVFLLLVVLVLAACGASTTPGDGESPNGEQEPSLPEETTTSAEAEVVMRNISFQPAEITVASGTTVTWINEDSAPHTITSGTRNNPSGLFNSGSVSGGGSFSFTFDKAGTYDYFCSIHPGMNGTVIVEP
ncbi:MAG: hypothetical protein A2Y73_07065 [Chloroflexi bacterium RBG_13_56_8]|nr:MAG: hypothetical protein A2Y73_07065 [Chloroflexi bacterium RBG_13_56_8]